MPNALRLTHRAQPSAASAPTVAAEMIVHHESEPLAAGFQWSARVSSDKRHAIVASCHLHEDGECRLWASIDRAGKYFATFVDGTECEPRQLLAFARALLAVAERVTAEHDAASTRLTEWRARYDAALEPIDLAPAP